MRFEKQTAAGELPPQVAMKRCAESQGSGSNHRHEVNRPASLPHAWRRWVAENKLLGIADEQIIATLVNCGIAQQVAADEIEAIAMHPYFQAADREAQRLRKLESLFDIHRALSSLSFDQGQIERRSRISRAEFRERYYATNRPVILTGLMAGSRMLDRWNPEYLRRTCGQSMVEIMAGRAQDPRYEVHSSNHKKEVRFEDYIQMVTAGGASNDCYLVANNGLLGRPEMKPLYDDVYMFPEYLERSRGDGQVFFWFGPSGTVTPLHHDIMNVLMAQVYGRKTVILISPDQTHRLYNWIGVYSEVDPERPDYDRFPLYRHVKAAKVTLTPGEALFIPVGWWHHVRSLEVSITVSYTNFVFSNHFHWNHPHLVT
jgi:hypothetical protein